MFGLFAPRCPLETTEKAWVERRMRWLADRLGRDRLLGATVVLPTDEFFPDHYRPDEACARALLVRMCRFMGVDPGALTLTVLPDDAMPGAAGLYEQRTRARPPAAREESNAARIPSRQEPPTPAVRERSKIFIAVSQLENPASLLATLAHEIGHEILLGGGVLTRDIPDHEQTTDLLTVFLGVGVFNANATVHESNWHYGATYSGWSIGRQGYLSSTVFGYALGVFAYVRGESSPRWARHLRPDAKSALRTGLRYLRKTGDSLFRPDVDAPRGVPTLGQVADGLAHKSPTFRLAALWELGWAGVAGPELLPAVIRCLDDPDAGVRAEAARTLAGFGPEAEMAVPRLLEIVQNDGDIWLCALPTLTALRADPAAVLPEVARLLRAHPAHAEMLAKVAISYGPAAESTVPALLDAFAHLYVRGSEFGTVLAAVRALVPDPEREALKHFNADPELARYAVWQFRQLIS